LTPHTRILFLSHCGHWGGAQKVLYLLVSGLDQSQFEPIVIVPFEGPLATALRGVNADVIVRPVPWWVGPRGDPVQCAVGFSNGFDARIESLVELIVDRQINVVFSNTLVIADGAIAASKAGVPHVWQALEMLSRDPAYAPPISLPLFYAAVTSLADTVVAVSSAVSDEIGAYGSTANVQVIHTGLPDDLAPKAVDPPAPQRSPGRQRVTFVGFLSERKGVATVVEAAAVVLARHPEATFWIVGPDGGCLASVTERIKQLGVDERVLLLGERDDVGHILDESCVFVLPATADPLPLVVLEAMRAGVPVVATTSGGCEEMVVDGATGYLVPIGDVAALADRICRLLADPTAAAEMGRRGRKLFLDHFSYPQFMQSVTAMLLAAASKPRDNAMQTAVAAAVDYIPEAYRIAALLATERTAFASERTTQKAACEALQGHITGMEQSLSWRCTAPIRRFLDAIRNLA